MSSHFLESYNVPSLFDISRPDDSSDVDYARDVQAHFSDIIDERVEQILTESVFPFFPTSISTESVDQSTSHMIEPFFPLRCSGLVATCSILPSTDSEVTFSFPHTGIVHSETTVSDFCQFLQEFPDSDFTYFDNLMTSNLISIDILPVRSPTKSGVLTPSNAQFHLPVYDSQISGEHLTTSRIICFPDSNRSCLCHCLYRMMCLVTYSLLLLWMFN